MIQIPINLTTNAKLFATLVRKEHMKQLKTNTGWLLEEPPTLTALGLTGFVLKKGDICSYIEKRRDNRWCCYKEFSEEYRSCEAGAMLSIKGSPFKCNSIDDALLHTGMSREEKNEVMLCYLKEFAVR